MFHRLFILFLLACLLVGCAAPAQIIQTETPTMAPGLPVGTPTPPPIQLQSAVYSYESDEEGNQFWMLAPGLTIASLGQYQSVVWVSGAEAATIGVAMSPLAIVVPILGGIFVLCMISSSLPVSQELQSIQALAIPVPEPLLNPAIIAAAAMVTPGFTMDVSGFVPPEPPPDGGCKFLEALGMPPCRVEMEEFLADNNSNGVRISLKSGETEVVRGDAVRIGATKTNVPPEVWDLIKNSANPTTWTSYVGTNSKLFGWGFGSWAWRTTNALARFMAGGPIIMTLEAISDEGNRLCLSLIQTIAPGDIIYANEAAKLWFFWIR